MHKYIDADALKRKFSYSDADTEDDKIWTATMRRMIDEVPAADVEPVRHGKWIKTNADFNDMPMEEFKCSICHEPVALREG